LECKKVGLEFNYKKSIHMTFYIYLYNMCIANFNGFDMDRALKVEKETQVEQLAT
jgi:hypothetical protein